MGVIGASLPNPELRAAHPAPCVQFASALTANGASELWCARQRDPGKRLPVVLGVAWPHNGWQVLIGQIELGGPFANCMQRCNLRLYCLVNNGAVPACPAHPSG